MVKGRLRWRRTNKLGTNILPPHRTRPDRDRSDRHGPRRRCRTVDRAGRARPAGLAIGRPGRRTSPNLVLMSLCAAG